MSGKRSIFEDVSGETPARATAATGGIDRGRSGARHTMTSQTERNAEAQRHAATHQRAGQRCTPY